MTRLLSFATLVLAAATPALRAQDLNSVIAGLREDIRILDERTRQLTVEVEQLKRENSGLRAQGDANYVTMAQMTAALADLERALRAGDRELAVQISKDMERLAKQTNAALDALTKGAARNTAPAVQFTPLPANTPGTTYEVQPGDTLASIAARFNSSVKDIQNANKIADPTKLQVGQTLFIPQR
jgi:LysM repeat protein